jgi:molecular chaperone GrpE
VTAGLANGTTMSDSEPQGPTTTAADDPAASPRARDETYDRLLRLTAEFDNFRKRTDRERREWTEGVTADVIRAWLPVVDDLERALSVPETGDAASQSFRRGVELIHRRALEVLRRLGAEPLDTIGRDFDPQWHEAVASEPADGHRDGEITAELSRGYRIGQRLLRAAQVKVARA